MAQSMGQVVRNYSPEFDRQPVGGANTGTALANGEFEFADLTATSPVVAAGNGDFGTGMSYFRAVVHLKTFVQGTAASSFAIEGADNVAMTTNPRVVAVQVIPAVAGDYTVVLAGVCSDGAKRYARVVFTPGAGASGTFDAFLAGCP